MFAMNRKLSAIGVNSVNDGQLTMFLNYTGYYDWHKTPLNTSLFPFNGFNVDVKCRSTFFK